MEVGTDLDRPIAAVGDAESGDGSASVEFDRAGLGEKFAWNHGVGAARQFVLILPHSFDRT